MSDLKYCQGTMCHEYKTKDRIRGTKGNKSYQTRRRSNFGMAIITFAINVVYMIGLVKTLNKL